MILQDVSLCPYFLFVIEDTISFKFGGVCCGCGCTGWLSFILSACFRHVLGLIFVSFIFFSSMFKDQVLLIMY